ncbi:hypothetical protein QQ054_38585 [Oscillatoria amoena NRMC-F 0135]|nr:hypothetical protein [Oscillatoria amoena NRMC-F 0135]
MGEFLFFLADYIKGKSIYAPIRRILNLLLSCSITSYIYVKFFGAYQWVDFGDYRIILDYVIKGQYIIPFSIFIVSHYSIEFLSQSIFFLFTYFYCNKHRRRALALRIKLLRANVNQDNSMNNIISLLQGLKRINRMGKQKAIFRYILNNLPNEHLEMIVEVSNTIKKTIQFNFTFFMRMIIALVVYYKTLQDFTPFLFFFTLIILFIILSLLLFGAWLTEITPYFFSPNLTLEKTQDLEH